jgi:hypothetical protein
MPKVQANRTLVKSPPELWAELSDIEALARHLGELGEIRITRTDPETTVAWEGDHARGTVEIEASGWGTKVTLTAEVDAPEPVTEPAPEPEPEPVPEPEPEPEAVTIEQRSVGAEPEAPTMAEPPRAGFLARWFGRRQPVELVAPEPEPVPVPDPSPEPEPDPEPPAPEPEPEPLPTPKAEADETLAVLNATLDALGSAHHRPFSRG